MENQFKVNETVIINKQDDSYGKIGIIRKLANNNEIAIVMIGKHELRRYIISHNEIRKISEY